MGWRFLRTVMTLATERLELPALASGLCEKWALVEVFKEIGQDDEVSPAHLEGVL